MLTHQEAVERDCTALYVLGDLPEPERDRFEEHLFDCPACTDSVKTAYLLLRGVEATWKHPIVGAEQPAATPAPKRTIKRSPRSWALYALPYAAILCLSLGTGVQYLALQKARAPQAVRSFPIPPQAKGDARQIQLPRNGEEFVELELDLLAPAPLYHWEIRSAGASQVLMHGEARPPASASVLKLLLPVHKLRPGRYEVALADRPGHENLYLFEVVAEPLPGAVTEP